MRFAATTALILFGLANITSAGDSLRAAFLNLGKVETALLASICEAATLADENFLYAPAENKRADKVVQGVVEVSVMGLYTELAKRTVVDDHDASHALTMAILRGDKRAKEAKQQAAELKPLRMQMEKGPENKALRQKLAQYEAKIELRRSEILRDAYLVSHGLTHTQHRPTGWWIPLVDPSGKWFTAIAEGTHAYLQDMS